MNQMAATQQAAAMAAGTPLITAQTGLQPNLATQGGQMVFHAPNPMYYQPVPVRTPYQAVGTPYQPHYRALGMMRAPNLARSQPLYMTVSQSLGTIRARNGMDARPVGPARTPLQMHEDAVGLFTLLTIHLLYIVVTAIVVITSPEDFIQSIIIIFIYLA